MVWKELVIKYSKIISIIMTLTIIFCSGFIVGERHIANICNDFIKEEIYENPELQSCFGYSTKEPVYINWSADAQKINDN